MRTLFVLCTFAQKAHIFSFGNGASAMLWTAPSECSTSQSIWIASQRNVKAQLLEVYASTPCCSTGFKLNYTELEYKLG